MAYLMYVSAALTHLWAIYAPQNQYWIMKGCRNAPFFMIHLQAFLLLIVGCGFKGIYHPRF